MNTRKMHTVRDEITKYLINEGHIKTAKDIRYMSYSTVLKYYLAKIS